MAQSQTRSPVSPVELQPLSVPTAISNGSTTQSASHESGGRSSTFEKESWLPFTLQWYYLVVPTILGLVFGSILVYLSIYSEQNHGLGKDNGSSAILFGWRFTPTLIAVLYAQMTVILFEDVKRSEPFARLAKAPAGGANAYGTLLQTPRAWWSIFIDVCFRRKRIGHTSWALICAAFINVIVLLAISPLSSALLTSEEVLVPKHAEFSRIIPKANTQIPMVPTRETYYRTMNAVMRNVSTSAWLNDTSLAFPFWPASEAAQSGPNLNSSSSTWGVETTTINSQYQCQNMTLTSAEIVAKRYSGVYVQAGYGPYNGTQPMATFVLESNDGCRYELSVHPGVDLAAHGGMTWSDASTFIPTARSILPIGRKVFTTNMTATDVWSRVSASNQCRGRDIIIMSSPFTLVPDVSPTTGSGLAENATYERAPGFRMRSLLCDFKYLMSIQTMKTATSGRSAAVSSDVSKSSEAFRDIPNSFINIAQFQDKSTQNDWKSYFDPNSISTGNGHPGQSSTFAPPGFSGMAPLLGVLSRFNINTLLDEPDLVRRVGSMKSRFFMEMIRDAFTDPALVTMDTTRGQATIVESRVVVLTEIGITLAALFYASAVLLMVVFWSSRLTRRPLNLRSDPASTVGLALMFKPRLARSSTIRSLHSASRVDLYTALQSEKYFSLNNELHKGDDSTDPPKKVKPRRDWRPGVIQVHMLLLLGILLALVLVAVLVLNAFSGRSLLSQRAFIFEADISKLGLSFSSFAPISIAPTVISIIVGLWWDQLDSTFRILQPFISMSRGPTPINAGAGLTYRSKSWVGAAIKAGRNKHWVLFMVAIGSVLAQVLTVSMSALFERESRDVVQQMTVPRNLEIRQVPLIMQVNTTGAFAAKDPAVEVLDNLYLDAPKNWLYGAGIQDSYNGTELPWAAEGWSFLPVDVSGIFNDSSVRSSQGDAGHKAVSSVNITITTPAIRARLDCRAIEEVANVSSWIERQVLDNDGEIYPNDEWAQINTTDMTKAYQLLPQIFEGTDSQTTMISRAYDAICCGNGSKADPQRAVMGYWSPVYPSDLTSETPDFPYQDLTWPVPITTKWLVGTAFNMSRGTTTGKYLYFTDVPRIQAARCTPIIETAEAEVKLNRDTGKIVSYTIGSTVAAAEQAWKDVFVQHEDDSKAGMNVSSPDSVNISTSFGVLFLDSLLGTADKQESLSVYERTDFNAFAFRDQNHGISMDLMTYSMYLLAEKDPEALLNYTTLATYADRTFQTFFQHFVNSELSLDKGGFAYQPIGDNSMETVGRSTSNGTFFARDSIPVPSTSRNITASVSHRIRVLHMNVTATYLSAAIIIWLIFTTVVVLCLQRRYTSCMNRDVQLIADMLLLIAGSDNLLELVAEKGMELKKNKDTKTMLRWFKDRDGQVRWGVEVVGGSNAVEWVDAPKQGFHVPVKNNGSSFRWTFWRRP